ncbi:unnamed protein product [Miscanthus lutarioriparius]|uniref:Peptidase A1 domain-containing protein n=1 Tax=Miscanthus lutarioriparius TaxID=422564 RepID=A0A811RGE1_9POAL|nr:unnamed protein product [Miscanthus lutarioriparius]
MTSSVASLSFFCLLVLLLPAPHGASSHASYKQGSRQIFSRTPGTGRSSGNSQQASTVSTATTCSSLATGLGNNKLPVVHRQSPCSQFHGLPSLTAADVLRRDASLIWRRFSSQSSLVAALPPAPAAAALAPSPAATVLAPSPAATIIPTNGSSDPRGALDYIVLVNYGTPKQQFPVFLDTRSVGVSLLRCKPCASGSNDCDPAFDTSQSSTFANVLCGSPDCPTNCSGGSFCPLDGIYSVINGTFAEDVLTLGPSTAIDNFKFVCLNRSKPGGQPVAGTLDLSRNRNSLPSQLSSSGQAPSATFSYCLPKSSSSQGFLSLGVNATVKDDNFTVHAPLDLPIPVGTFGNNGTNLDVGTTFTMLAPDAYTALSNSFQKQMSQYNFSSPGIDGFDTCFNFTDLNDLVIPNVQFKFSNGDILVIDADQMLYYDDTDAAPFTMACLAFSSLDAGDSFSAVIGSYTLATTEVVYNVAGGEVGFIPWSC